MRYALVAVLAFVACGPSQPTGPKPYPRICVKALEAGDQCAREIAARANASRDELERLLALDDAGAEVMRQDHENGIDITPRCADALNIMKGSHFAAQCPNVSWDFP